MSSGFDLTLALVEDDYGFSLGRATMAQDMVMYLRRPGGQLQFSRYNLSQSGSSGPFSELQNRILQNLTGRSVRRKAGGKSSHEPAQFHPVFTRDRGVSGTLCDRSARLAAARQLLEQTDDPLSVIAEKRIWHQHQPASRI